VWKNFYYMAMMQINGFVVSKATQPHIIWYTTHSMCNSGNSEGSKKLPDDGRLLPKHVGASLKNKGAVQSVHIVGYFYCYYYIYIIFLLTQVTLHTLYSFGVLYLLYCSCVLFCSLLFSCDPCTKAEHSCAVRWSTVLKPGDRGFDSRWCY
jgi:hypothetical protein